MPYILETVKTKKTVHVRKYYTYRFYSKGEKRRKKEKASTEKMIQINFRNRVKKLTWILEDNFETGDLLVRLSYKRDQKPADKKEMQKKIQQFFRKLRKEYRKLGMEMKYVHVFEVGKRGAWHHHIVLNNIDIRIIQNCWEYGYIHTVPLDDTGEYSKLANYLMKFAGRNVGKYTGKSYTHSKNLTIPKPVKKIISGRDAFSTRPQAKKGYWIPADMIREGTTEDGYRFIEYVQIATGRDKSG